jgi:hypothetical protein
MSPWTTVAFVHVVSSGVELNTYFSTGLMKLANGSMSLPGQNAAQPS